MTLRAVPAPPTIVEPRWRQTLESARSSPSEPRITTTGSRPMFVAT